MTMCEAILWKELKGKQMMGFDFDRQRPIDNYIVDFYCKDLMLAIEVDGSTHYTEQGVENDSIRQEKLEKLGVRFLRFDDDDIKTNINGVLEIIQEWIRAHPELIGRIDDESHPPPNPSKEGSLVKTTDKSPLLGGDLGVGNTRRKKGKQFHFKQFSVRHDRSGMKVGTDGVLLGAWVDVKSAKRILDIGTGTGIVALMLAQRTQPDVTIDAVEIDSNAIEDAAENFSSSPWSNRLTLHRGRVQEFSTSEKFDLVVSNPPYFIDSYKPPTDQRIIARHAESLSFSDLLRISGTLLSENGTLNVILPNTEGLQFIDLAEKSGFYCSRKWLFRTRKEKSIERFLLEFSRIKTDLDEGEILLYSSGENWSNAYQELTREFYLKL